MLEPGVLLPEGQRVEVIPLTPSAEVGDDDDLPGAGLWRDRAELGDSAAVASELRQATSDRAR